MFLSDADVMELDQVINSYDQYKEQCLKACFQYRHQQEKCGDMRKFQVRPCKGLTSEQPEKKGISTTQKNSKSL